MVSILIYSFTKVYKYHKKANIIKSNNSELIIPNYNTHILIQIVLKCKLIINNNYKINILF